MATIKVIYEDGVFKPQGPVSLPEHAEAEVLVPSIAPAGDEDSTGWKAMREFIGLAGDAGGGNASEEHDAILYRRP